MHTSAQFQVSVTKHQQNIKRKEKDLPLQTLGGQGREYQREKKIHERDAPTLPALNVVILSEESLLLDLDTLEAPSPRLRGEFCPLLIWRRETQPSKPLQSFIPSTFDNQVPPTIAFWKSCCATRRGHVSPVWEEKPVLALSDLA